MGQLAIIVGAYGSVEANDPFAYIILVGSIITLVYAVYTVFFSKRPEDKKDDKK
jgi:hypothetical protein